MVWIDWVIVIVMAVSVISGLAQGFFRSACGLAGLVIGLEVASWNYARVSALLMPIFSRQSLSPDAAGSILIAVLILAVFAIIGALLAKAALSSSGWDALMVWPAQFSDSFRA